MCESMIDGKLYSISRALLTFITERSDSLCLGSSFLPQFGREIVHTTIRERGGTQLLAV